MDARFRFACLDRRRRARRARRGNVLLLAIGSITSLVIAGGTLLVAVTGERTSTEQAVVNVLATDASVSGAEQALAELDADPNFAGTLQVDVGGAIADVSVVDWADDGADNDDDGAIDEADEADFLAVTSIGQVNAAVDAGGNPLGTRRAASRTDVVLRRIDLDIAAEQALYVDDPNAQFKFSGNAFLISGNDTNLDGTPGPNAALPGIGTVGDPADIADQLSSAQEDNVTGAGGTPSVGSVGDIDLAGTMAGFASIASLEFTGADESYNGQLGDFANQVAVVTHAHGNLKLTGGASGCGILIVDGDLDINGGFDYAGLIYVGGAVRFNGGGGGKNLRGALFALGAVSGNDVTINGSVDVRYSSQAIALVTTQIAGGVEVVSWRQR